MTFYSIGAIQGQLLYSVYIKGDGRGGGEGVWVAGGGRGGEVGGSGGDVEEMERGGG